MFGLPAAQWEIRIMFATFSFSLALRVLHQLCVEDTTDEQPAGEIPTPLSATTGAMLVGVGLFGGLCVGYIGKQRHGPVRRGLTTDGFTWQASVSRASSSLC